MHRSRSCFTSLLGAALAGALLAPAPARAQDQQDERTGAYMNLGVNIGAPDFDIGGLDGEAGGGVQFGAGYRVLSWLAAELQFDLLAGSDVEVGGNDIGDAQYWAITANAKAYPLSAIADDGIPTWLQPYGRFGMGGGEIEIDFDGGGDSHEGTFVARFGAGIDFVLHRHWGAYVDGGYHVASEDDLDGVGIFTLGAFYRF